MNLYVLRHASAGTRRVNPILDTRRPLDKEGKKQCLQLGHVLHTMRLHFDLILSSPLKRSLQTASLIGMETGYDGSVLTSNALAPTATFADFQKLLTEFAEAENMLVVGHNPNLTQFLGLLMAAPKPARVRLRKGSIARINYERGNGTLQWMLDPRTVRALYTASTTSSRLKTSRK